MRLCGDCLADGSYPLNDEQFKEIVGNFQISAKASPANKKIKQICLNLLSINTKMGLYVLAYRRLNLDVKRHRLRPEPEVTICREFTIDGTKQSIRKFLDADDFYLLNDFIDSDDIYELAQYVKNNGNLEVSTKGASSRALGVKPYSTEKEEAFLANLNHALGNVFNTNRKCVIHKEVALSQVFTNNVNHSDLFYTGRFDFVVYEKDFAKNEIPILAIELDGKEHFEDAVVKERDRKKNEICRQNGFELIRVENSYARRYHFINYSSA